jgi:hypothetical protein
LEKTSNVGVFPKDRSQNQIVFLVPKHDLSRVEIDEFGNSFCSFVALTGK